MGQARSGPGERTRLRRVETKNLDRPSNWAEAGRIGAAFARIRPTHRTQDSKVTRSPRYRKRVHRHSSRPGSLLDVSSCRPHFPSSGIIDSLQLGSMAYDVPILMRPRRNGKKAKCIMIRLFGRLGLILVWTAVAMALILIT